MNRKEAIEKALAEEKGMGKRQVLLKELWKLERLEERDSSNSEPTAGDTHVSASKRI